MKNFYQWAEEKKLELPPLQEKTARAGVMHWAYPQAYSQRGVGYPDAYFMAHSADAAQKMGYAKSKNGVMSKDVAPKSN